jgi:hypothetical protein
MAASAQGPPARPPAHPKRDPKHPQRSPANTLKPPPTTRPNPQHNPGLMSYFWPIPVRAKSLPILLLGGPNRVDFWSSTRGCVRANPIGLKG